MPPHPRNELVPLTARNPVVRLCKQEKEFGHAEPRGVVGAEHLPQLLVPLVRGDGLHLVGAHVQRLPDRVGALQEGRRDGGGAGAEA